MAVANVNVWPSMMVHPVIHEADLARGSEQRCKRCGKLLRQMTDVEGNRWSYLPGALLREVALHPQTWGGARDAEPRTGYRTEPFDLVRLKATCSWRK